MLPIYHALTQSTIDSCFNQTYFNFFKIVSSQQLFTAHRYNQIFRNLHLNQTDPKSSTNQALFPNNLLLSLVV
jgi:hypothetical protein